MTLLGDFQYCWDHSCSIQQGWLPVVIILGIMFSIASIGNLLISRRNKRLGKMLVIYSLIIIGGVIGQMYAWFYILPFAFTYYRQTFPYLEFGPPLTLGIFLSWIIIRIIGKISNDKITATLTEKDL